MPATVQARFLGNAGVELSATASASGPNADGAPRTARVYLDAFIVSMPHVGTLSVMTSADLRPADAILVTHAHADHFRPSATADAARRTGALVVGPRPVIDQLSRQLPDEQLRALDPVENRRPYASLSVDLGPVTVTAFRTRHAGSGHNSYLVDLFGWRGLHDGDNEFTQRYDVPALGHVDALFSCPWQGSGAGAFVNALGPKRWFLVHLTAAELADHARGEFLGYMLPDDHPPPPALAPAPGETVDA